MSGVFGLVRPGEQSEEGIERALERMAARLRLQPWTRAQARPAPGGRAGLGQVGIGVFSATPQPVFSPDDRLAAVVFGCIYNAARLRAELEKTGPPLPAGDDAALALRLYRQRGPNLAADLEGEFALAVWDADARRLVLSNDRMALYPHYYARLPGGGLAFAPLVAGVLAAGPIPRRLNLDAAAEFLRFQRVLGEKTFLQDVQPLPYASTLVYDLDNDRLDCRHYWDIHCLPAWPGIRFDEAVAETGRRLRAAVDRAMQLPQRKGVFLSGGLDSRTLLGFAGQGHPPPPSLTYGYPDSTDVQYALRIARAVGSSNRFVAQQDGCFLLDHMELHLRATEGFTSFIHMHAANAMQPAREVMDVNLMGHMGDILLGDSGLGPALPALRAPDDLAFQVHLFHLYNQVYTWPGITESEERLLFTPAAARDLGGRAFSALAADIQPLLHLPPAQRLNLFIAFKAYNQAYLHNITMLRTTLEVVSPFCDAALMEWLLSMPVEYRLNDRMYKAVINREIPRVTRIPRDKDDLLPVTNPWLRKINEIELKVRRNLSIHPPPAQTLHGDPEVWLREDLGDWVADVLFDRRTLERGLFNPAFLRSIYERAIGGQEQWVIGKLAPLVTFELMLRSFCDVGW